MTLIGLGIDPGFRHTGIAAVALHEDGSFQSLGVRVMVTLPEKDRKFTNLRTSMDDTRRSREHWVAITESLGKIHPNVIGVENYTVYEDRGAAILKEAAAALLAVIPAGTPSDYLAELARNGGLAKAYLDRLADLAEALRGEIRGSIGMGAAAKTILVNGVSLGAAFTANTPVFVFQPADLKKPFGGHGKASKDEVAAGLYRLIPNLEEKVDEKITRKALREHATDATGHAVLALKEYRQLRLDAHAGIHSA